MSIEGGTTSHYSKLITHDFHINPKKQIQDTILDSGHYIMDKKDEFGHDPNIQKTRAYFSRMETMDTQARERSGISFFDPRLREGRAMRFKLFENSCSLAARKGLWLDENLALKLFDLCQDMAFKTCGLPVSSRDQTKNLELISLIKEALK